MSSPTIRLALPGDLDAVCALCRAVKRRLAQDHISIWEDDYPSREIFAGDIAASGMLVAEADGRIVGSVSWNDDITGEYYFDVSQPAEAEAQARALAAACGAALENTVSAHRLMVLPEARHAGTAAALLQEAERRSRGRWMILFAAECNVPARRLYARLGYRDIGEHDFSFGRMHYLVKTPQALAR